MVRAHMGASLRQCMSTTTRGRSAHVRAASFLPHGACARLPHFPSNENGESDEDQMPPAHGRRFLRLRVYDDSYLLWVHWREVFFSRGY